MRLWRYRWIRVFLTLCLAMVALVLVSVGAIWGGAMLSPPCKLAEGQARYDVAVVLGSGVGRDGTLLQPARGRIEAGVALWRAGVVDGLHFTGAGAFDDDRSTAGEMAAYAVQLGVPQGQITLEEASMSTLQNALYSKPLLQDMPSRIVVTEGFHVTRSWMSFLLMGMPPKAICHSVRFRVGGPRWRGPGKMLRREVLALWYNLGRGMLWHGAMFVGADRTNVDTLLN